MTTMRLQFPKLRQREKRWRPAGWLNAENAKDGAVNQ